jgi:hypothetical protein
LTYSWTVQSGEGTLNNSNIANPVYTPPDVSSNQTFTLTIDVSDGEDITSDTVNITVTDTIIPNQAPVITSVTASPSTISDTETSQLQVNANDPDSGPSALSYSWTVQSGEGTLNNYNIANPVYTPPDVSSNQTFTLTVNVSDGEDITSDTVNITVTDATPPSQNLVGWWKLDDGTGSIATDSAGSNDGTITGATWTTGKVGGALDFDGDGDYVVIGSSVSVNNIWGGGGTFIAWFNPSSIPTDPRIISWNTGDDRSCVLLDAPSTINMRRSFNGALGKWHVNFTSPTNEWTHLAITYNDDSDLNDPTFYVNGTTLTVAKTATPSGSSKSSSNAYLGSDRGIRRYFNGKIDDVRIYDYELSSQEVQNLYNPNQAPVITSVTTSPSTISDTETSQLQVNANDPDSGPGALTYSWTVQSGEGTLNNYNIANPIYTPPDVSTNQTFTLTVNVSDGEDITSDTVNITVTDTPNQVPVITSVTTSPSTISDTETSQLQVNANDPDSGPSALSYSWTVQSGEGTLNNYNIANPVYTPPDVSTNQTFTLTVDVSDGEDITSDTVDVMVTDAATTPNPVSHWKFDEGAGSIAYDSAGSNDGTITEATWTTGIFDGALDFDGSNDYVNCGNDPTLQIDGSMTLAFWIYPRNLGAYRENPLDKSYGGEFALTLEDNPDAGKLSYYHGTQRTTGYYWDWAALDTGTIMDDDWQFIAITRNVTDKVMKSYYDGQLIKTATYSSDTNKLPSTSTYNFNIGSGYSHAFNGLIDDARIYNCELSSQEIQDLYSQGGTSGTSLSFSDDFSDGNYDGWSLADQGTLQTPMSWSASTNVMVQSSNTYTSSTGTELPTLGTYAYLIDGLSWTDYKTTLTIKSADDDAIGLMFRYQDQDNYYRFSWDKQRAYRRLVKCVNGQFTLLAEDSVTYVTNQTYDLEVIANDDSLKVSIDSSEIFSVTDSSFSSGSIALYCWGNVGAYFDDISVTPISSLVSHWKFDEGTETTVSDSVGNNDGTIVGASWVTGLLGGALDFDGIDNYVSIPDNSNLSFGDGTNDEPFSISTWFYKNSEDSSVIVSKTYDTSPFAMEYVLSANENEQISTRLYDDNGGNQIYAMSANSAITIGQWHHYVMTYDGSGSQSGLTVYLDGFDVTDTRGSAGTYTAMDDEATNLYLGVFLLNDPTWRVYCNGTIDEVMIFDKELTEGEVRLLPILLKRGIPMP